MRCRFDGVINAEIFTFTKTLKNDFSIFNHSFIQQVIFVNVCAPMPWNDYGVFGQLWELILSAHLAEVVSLLLYLPLSTVPKTD